MNRREPPIEAAGATLKHLRQKVFRKNQSEFAVSLGVAQTRVSRWERGTQNPRYADLLRIRNAAMSSGISWDDRWFFSSPEEIPPSVNQ